MNVLNTSRSSHRLFFIVLATLLWCMGSNTSYAAINFESPILYDLLGESPLAIEYADYDGDGDIDIATTQHTPAEELPEDEGVYIHLNNGDGNFILGSHVHFTGQPQFLISADFDSDNDIDLAAMNTGSNDVVILLNDGTGNFTVDSRLQSDFYFLHGMTAVDFDRDDDMDIAISIVSVSDEEVETAVVLLKNDGVANFEQTTTLHTHRPYRGSDYIPNGFGALFVKDLNSDSIDDIVVISGEMHIFFNNGDGTFTHHQNELPPYGYITSLTPIDVDDDGDLDMLAYQNGIFSTMINIRDGIFYPDGEAIFVPGQILDIPTIQATYTTTDLDNDGDFDITIASNWGELYIYLQNNIDDFNLLESINIPNLNDSDPITSADFNNDNKDDLIVLVRESEYANTYHIFLQTSVENQQPTLNPIGNQTVEEGQTLEVTLSATDPDGDNLTYTAANIPSGSNFDPETGTFSWTPTYDDAGNYENIEFTVMDDGQPMELDVELITISVGNVNRAPEIVNPGPQEILEKNTLTFDVSAVDPDSDTAILSATDIPEGATFDGTTFLWTPTTSQEGVYTVTFTATDDGTPNESSEIGVVITVGNNPTPVEQTVELITVVVDYNLPVSTANSYFANLNKVETFIENGNITPAVNQLKAFISKVLKDYSQGKITAEVLNSLIAPAENILHQLLNN